MSEKALEGIRAVELGPYMALPTTGRILGSLGAEVIKVDTNTGLDDIYFTPGWAPGCGQPEYQAMKKRITLNLRETKGRDILLRLLEVSDIFMTNVRLASLAKWGLALDELRKKYPKLIIMWQGGWGARGPYSEYKLYGNLVQHVAGITSSTGFPETAPGCINTSYSDWHCGVFQPMAIIGALERRRRTGDGALIEASILLSGVVTAGPDLVDFQANDRLAIARGNKDQYNSPYGAYPCKGEDEYCAICVFTNAEWESFCEVLELRDLVSDSRFATMVDRVRNADELDAIISARTINYDKGDLMEKMQAAGVPACIVSKGRDLYESKHLKSHDFYREIPYYIADRSKPGRDWEQSPHTTIAWSTPVRLSGTPWEAGPYHRIGEDNDYVYRELLKMSEEEVKALTDEGILI